MARMMSQNNYSGLHEFIHPFLYTSWALGVAPVARRPVANENNRERQQSCCGMFLGLPNAAGRGATCGAVFCLCIGDVSLGMISDSCPLVGFAEVGAAPKPAALSFMAVTPRIDR